MRQKWRSLATHWRRARHRCYGSTSCFSPHPRLRLRSRLLLRPRPLRPVADAQSNRKREALRRGGCLPFPYLGLHQVFNQHNRSVLIDQRILAQDVPVHTDFMANQVGALLLLAKRPRCRRPCIPDRPQAWRSARRPAPWSDNPPHNSYSRIHIAHRCAYRTSISRSNISQISRWYRSSLPQVLTFSQLLQAQGNHHDNRRSQAGQAWQGIPSGAAVRRAPACLRPCQPRRPGGAGTHRCTTAACSRTGCRAPAGRANPQQNTPLVPGKPQTQHSLPTEWQSARRPPPQGRPYRKAGRKHSTRTAQCSSCTEVARFTTSMESIFSKNVNPSRW